MKTFDSELSNIIISTKTIEEMISGIKSLISKYAPKEKKQIDKYFVNSGYNQYRAELFREMNINDNSR